MSDDLRDREPFPEDADDFDDDGNDEAVDDVETDSLEEALRERDEAKDKMFRALAELENFRTRVNRERVETLKYASLDLVRDLLPVWDNLERALEAAEKTHNIESLIEGVHMVGKQFLDVLAKYHCERIEAVGLPFDPNFHASVAQFPSEEYPANVVTHETQVGFKLYDRIVRPSQVVLSSGEPSPEK